MYTNLIKISSFTILLSINTFCLAENNPNLQHNALACMSCHSSPAMPQIKGMPKNILTDKMQSYSKDLKKDTIMHQLLKGYSDKDIEELATYFSEVK